MPVTRDILEGPWAAAFPAPRIRGTVGAYSWCGIHGFTGRYTGAAMIAALARVESACESCGAKVVLEPLARTARCPYCDSPAVVDRPATADRPDPVFAIGFAVGRADAEGRVRSWLGRKKLGPFGLARAVAEKVQGVYVPAYLYSARAVSRYRARIGEDYWVTEVGRDSKGRSTVRRRRRTEVRDLEGPHRAYLADVLVTASRGLANDEMEAVEPFDLRELQRYAPGLVSGWASEEPSLTRDECLALARREASVAAGRMLRGFMPGDSVVGLDHRTSLEDESADLCLLPLWVFALRHAPDRPPARVLVNGQTGAVWGRVPVSWGKIALIAAVILGLVALPILVASLAGLLP